MTRFEQWVIRITRREVQQDHNTGKNIANLYRMIREACEDEFIDDGHVTLNFFLKEKFEEVQQ